LDSATSNITSTGTTPSPSSRPAHAGSPVAHETPVVATGARTEENSGKRELFKETTTTALVFPNGGVIRLSAAVAPGQLLFLTNQQTKREVVAQVTRKRNNQPGYYVELEFTEPAPDFWGVQFPEAPAAVPATPDQPAPVELELLQSDEPTSDDLSPSAPAPTVEEVQALVDEVEALRAQLRSMQTQSVAPTANAPSVADVILEMSSAPAPPSKSLAQLEAPTLAAAAASSTELPPLSEMLSSLLDATPAPQPVPQPSLASVPAEHPTPIATAAPAVAPPLIEEQFPPEEALLPKPALDFQQPKKPKKSSAPKEAKAVAVAPAASADRSGLLRLALLAVVSLFAVTVAAWNMHWLPGTANLPGSTSSKTRPATNSSSSAHRVPQQKADPRTDATATPQIPNASLPRPDSAATKPDSRSIQASSDAIEDPAANDAAANPKPRENSAPLLSIAKRSVVRPTQTAEAISASPFDPNTAIVLPRLIKSVRAVAPGDALREFVTGNVTLDALIDKSGHVESMKVLSGPPTFHKAAMEALKQYRYEPARQHGQPISAHITVTVPFLFEP
jgi:periplasmic protein TonB